MSIDGGRLQVTLQSRCNNMTSGHGVAPRVDYFICHECTCSALVPEDTSYTMVHISRTWLEHLH
jgi:hypothetical protein